MPISAKLHILLILTVVGVSLYMFMLYKEVKLFEKDMAMMKIELANIRSSIGNVETKSTNKTKPIKQVQVDDDVSITSNEIKDILTNIQQVEDQEDDDQEEEEEDQEEEEEKEEEKEDDIKSIIETTITEQLPKDCNFTPISFEMTEDQLNACKYEEIRVFLRKNGINMRGSKNDMIKKILLLKPI